MGPSSRLPIPFQAYKGSAEFIFISYAHKDADLVFPVIGQWADVGYRVWYDEGIDPGNEWPEEIAKALEKCAFFVVFITPNSAASSNCRNEINFAINRNKPFLAIHLVETKLPAGMELRMGDIQAILKYQIDEATFERKIRSALPQTTLGFRRQHGTEAAPTESRWKPLLMGIALGFVIWCGIQAVGGISLFRRLDSRVQESFYRWRGAISPPAEITLISIGDIDFQVLKVPWPWSRGFHAVLLRILQTLPVKLVGYDILFVDPDPKKPEHDQALATEAVSMGNIVFPISLQKGADGKEEAILPYFALRHPSIRLGFANISDFDEIEPGVVPLHRGVWNSFGFELGETLASGASAVKASSSMAFGTIPTDQEGRAHLCFFGPSSVWHWVSFSQVLKEFDALRRGATSTPVLDSMRNRIVLVGVAGIGLGDVVEGPFGLGYGVELHATFLANLISGTFLHPVSRVLEGFLLILLLPLAGVFTLSLGVTRGAGILSLLFLGVLGFDYLIFTRLHIWFPPARLLAGLASTIPIGYAVRSAFVTREARILAEKKKQMEETLGVFVSSNVARMLIERPEMIRGGHEEKVLSVLFTDLKGFSAISEKYFKSKSSLELINHLNQFYGAMADVILSHDGTVDKIMGNSLMAIFGAPYFFEDHPLRVVQAALAMQARLDEMRLKWRQEGQMEFVMRVGVNTGIMVAGTMGSAQRMNYTVFGNSVNLAQAIEGVNRLYDTTLLISEFTYHEISRHILAREIDRVKLPLHPDPFSLFEPICLREKSNPLLLERVEKYQEGLQKYRTRSWKEAETHFQSLLEAFPSDGPSRRMAERCRLFQSAPPGEDWDGAFLADIRTEKVAP